MNPPAALNKVTGFLVDHQIQECLNNGILLEKGTWDVSCIRHASYTLRIGENIFVAKAIDSAHAVSKDFTVQKLIKGGSVTLNPGDTAQLHSIERLRIPEWILGFTVARGLLYVESLAPENTYVDPGFTGTIYTTVTNISNRVITLDYGMPVARLFFYKLASPVQNGYSSGSALGIAQQLKSVRSVAFGTPEMCRTADGQGLIEAIRQTPTSGMHLAEYCQRQKARHLQLLTVALLWPALLAVVISSTTIASWMDGPITSKVIASLIATIIVAIFTWLTPKVFKPLLNK